MPRQPMSALSFDPPQPQASATAPVEPDPRRYLELAPKAPEGLIEVARLWPDGGGAELELEIGFGRGMFLLERAQAAPDSRVLGIEIKRKWAYLVEQRAIRLGLPNVRVFGADAREVLGRLTPDACLTRMFMHFPDPWWKARHAKRRLRGPSLFDPAARLLRAGGELFVQTDVEDRAATLLEDLRAHGAFELPAAGYVAENPYNARSNREKRAITDGLPVYRIIATRRG
jgi:tRNA (guanine-N7-)-methyltransferase